jgi:hypothetical protein
MVRVSIKAGESQLHYQQGGVLPLNMVDKSTSPLQTPFGAVFCDEAVQTGHLTQT